MIDLPTQVRTDSDGLQGGSCLDEFCCIKCKYRLNYHAEYATMINLRPLRTFVVTAELGGLGRACARLNLSQPAASRQIRALESELGVALFEHVGRGLRLTSHGQDLLQRSRQLLSDADLLAEHARALRGGQPGTLKIAASADCRKPARSLFAKSSAPSSRS
jgi:hypothetical protein